jgi:hypothetical protein
MRPTILALVSVPLVVGCAEPDDVSSHVKDLRILAIAAEPPEVLFDRPGPAGDADAARVVWRALVADPRGLVTTYAWRLCPAGGETPCAEGDVAPSLLDALRGEAAALVQRSAAGQLEPDGARMQVAPFEVELPGGLGAAALLSPGAQARNEQGEAWPSAVLTVGDGADKVIAQKRVKLSPRELAQWNDVVVPVLGQPLCAAGESDACLPLRPRTPNRNPTVTEVRVARGARAGTDFEALSEGTPLEVAPGEEVRLLPVLGPEASEAYQELDATLKEHRFFVAEKTEQAVVSWFATAGTFRDELTSVPLTKTLDTVFSAPKEPPADGLVSLWLVVRDGRGGAAWRELRIVVR